MPEVNGNVIADMRTLKLRLNEQLGGLGSVPYPAAYETLELALKVMRGIDRLAARVAAAERVVQAAREVADDEAKCRYDHNDFCQAHYSSRPCREEVLRDALAAWEAGK